MTQKSREKLKLVSMILFIIKGSLVKIESTTCIIYEKMTFCFTRLPRRSQRCSIGEKSGDRAGHRRTVVLFYSRWSLQMRVVWGRALSCWNMETTVLWLHWSRSQIWRDVRPAILMARAWFRWASESLGIVVYRFSGDQWNSDIAAPKLGYLNWGWRIFVVMFSWIHKVM